VRTPNPSAFPAKAGTQTLSLDLQSTLWIPAFAGKAAEGEGLEHVEAARDAGPELVDKRQSLNVD
jgi:hypothetical protein